MLKPRVMAEIRRRISVDIRWTAIFKILAAAVLVWLWLKLVQLVLVLVVAVLLAVTLNPVIDWFERRGWPRWRAALLVFVVLVATFGGFAWLTWNSVTDQAAFAGKHLSQVEQDLMDRIPQWMQDAAGVTGGQDVQSHVSVWALQVGR